MTATLIRHYKTVSQNQQRERRIRDMKQEFRTKISRRRIKQNMRHIIHKLQLT